MLVQIKEALLNPG